MPNYLEWWVSCSLFLAYWWSWICATRERKSVGSWFFWLLGILVGSLFLLLWNGSVTMSVGGLAFDKILVMEEIHVFAAVQTFFIFMWKLYQMGSTNFKKLNKDLEVEQFRHKSWSRFISSQSWSRSLLLFACIMHRSFLIKTVNLEKRNILTTKSSLNLIDFSEHMNSSHSSRYYTM